MPENTGIFYLALTEWWELGDRVRGEGKENLGTKKKDLRLLDLKRNQLSVRDKWQVEFRLCVSYLGFILECHMYAYIYYI